MKLEKTWHEQLKDHISLPYMQNLKTFLEREKQQGISIYPSEDQVFSAFFYTPFPEVKVVIIGQDPYHSPGQAHGLSFSVLPNVPPPPSLRNIFQELKNDIGSPYPSNGCLIPWAKQGVFLLNTILTVRSNHPGSHRGKGWEQFTDAVIEKLVNREDPIIFLLWGKFAQKKQNIIQNHPQHIIFSSAHPSPYSVSKFYGTKPFSRINESLRNLNKKEINWII
ncbi:MAG: uracil-DNA glycosylase [Candidatus Staskawiczbacteria bacterium]|nr:uracil-DNA glycosylase [Candidatus Staskawiczbacteria bacterium]